MLVRVGALMIPELLKQQAAFMAGTITLDALNEHAKKAPVSERRARKDAERIENGMRKAVRMWETADYWKSRAAGAIRHAKYKERPDVRARRIKTIEFELAVTKGR